MFSDTHFHFHHLTEERGLNGAEILTKLVERNTFFGLDIGTRCDDLLSRQDIIEKSINDMAPESQPAAREMIYYSAGIWPDTDEILNRFEAIKQLEKSIEDFNLRPQNKTSTGKSKLVAIGEGGLDHHWNPSGVDGRCESDFDQKMYDGEKELFQMQLELSKKMNLPFIVHSRDAFEESLDCIKNIGFHNGIIHCYSYGINEARAFLDLGWHIAFGGATTYTKKAKMDEMTALLRYIPDDRLLMETDSPYLTPVPFRGQTNTPVFVEHCYNFVAQARQITAEQLSILVDDNITKLFNI